MDRGASSHVGPDGGEKVRYDTRKIARRAARDVGRKRGTMHEYACDSCGGWHLSSGPRRREEP